MGAQLDVAGRRSDREEAARGAVAAAVAAATAAHAGQVADLDQLAVELLAAHAVADPDAVDLGHHGDLAGQDYFAGASPTLADFYALPILHYLSQVPDGESALASCGALTAWMARMNGRDSVSSTVPQLG